MEILRWLYNVGNAVWGVFYRNIIKTLEVYMIWTIH